MDKRKFTPERMLAEFAKKRPDLIVVSENIQMSDRIEVTSKICGHSWSAYCSNLLHKNSGCPVCFHGVEPIEDYKARLRTWRPRIEVLSSTMTSCKKKMKYRCLDCGLEFEATPYKFFDRESGHGCPVCGHKIGGTKNRLSNDEFLERVASISPDIEVLSEYVNKYTSVRCRCKVCGHVWDATPENLTCHVAWCPNCRMPVGEKKIASWLDKNGIDYIRQYRFDDCKDKMRLPFDFFLPKYRACIEYDGEQHFKSIKYFGGLEHLKYTARHDAIKDEYCTANDIVMWRIPYFEGGNIDEDLHVFIAHCKSKCEIENASPGVSGLVMA